VCERTASALSSNAPMQKLSMDEYLEGGFNVRSDDNYSNEREVKIEKLSQRQKDLGCSCNANEW
jgi:hypothetical protein